MARATKKGKSGFVSVLVIAVVGLLAIGGKLGIVDLSFMGDAPSDVESDFSVHYLDVGQGDCEVIFDHGKVMLIDAGESDESTTVRQYLNHYDVTEIDYVVATHPHSDHIGGLTKLLEEYEIKNVIMPKLSKDNTPTTSTYERFLNAVKASGAKVIAANPGSRYTLGQADFQVLAPFEQDDDLNNMSVVLRMEYGTNSFLFMGDAGKRVERQILNKDFAVDCDVLKLGHHGSSTSNSEDFLLASSPKYAIACCGKGNKYGHPHGETVDLLNELGVELLRTDENGTVVASVDSNGTLTVQKEKK
ncbi:MAG TPA: MBL fold metallo-hydrolase [Ruminococcaceae bacterium]|nr:MBL fold metallo-hydrolase [Oscillospiraceae bacterium]